MFRNPDVPDCGWVEGRDRWWQDEIPSQSSECAVEWVGPASPSLLLFLSSASLRGSCPWCIDDPASASACRQFLKRQVPPAVLSKAWQCTLLRGLMDPTITLRRWTQSTLCSCCTPQGPRASRRGFSTPQARLPIIGRDCPSLRVTISTDSAFAGQEGQLRGTKARVSIELCSCPTRLP